MNAIIIAAGTGSRLRPLTHYTPKPLIEVHGKSFIERNIEYLIESGISEIIIVIGYMKEKFLFLKEKYENIKLIFNPKYEEYNNIYSLYLAKDYLKDTYILDGDIFLKKNIFEKKMEYSCYLSKKIVEKNEEWQLIEQNGKIVDVVIGGEKNYIMSGISFWTNEESQKIRYYLNKYILDENKKNFYWDNIIKDNIKKFCLKIFPLSSEDITEIDTFEELKKVDSKYAEKEFEIQRILMDANLDIDKIVEIKILGGMTNRNYLVSLENKKYVLRHSGLGTEGMLNRKNEARNSEAIRELGIDVNQIYYNENSGDKISVYIEDVETLDSETSKFNFDLIVNILKKLHNSKIIFGNRFDVFKEINKYEKLAYEAKATFYKEYEVVKKKVKKLENQLESLGISLLPCHNDTVPENFLKKNRKLYLIDWEYSGMNDPMWDLAAFSLENNLEKDEEEEFLELYFGNTIPENEYLKIQIFQILQDFLWSIWAIVKQAKGASFGDYGIQRFERCKKKLEAINE